MVASAQMVLARCVLVGVGDDQVVHGRIGGVPVSRGGVNDGLQSRKRVHQGLSREHPLKVVIEGCHRGIHVKPKTSFRVVGSWVRVDAHDRRSRIDVVGKRGQCSIAAKHDHEVPRDEIGSSHMFSWLEINVVLVVRGFVKRFFQRLQPVIMNFFEVLLEDDQDVHVRPCMNAIGPASRTHPPAWCSANIHKSPQAWSPMEGNSPWGDLPEEQTKPTEATAIPQSVSISQGFAPMNSGTLLSGSTEMPTGQIIYLQPPSSAPKVIGILVIIYAVFGLLGNVFSLLGSVDMGNGTLMALDVGNLAASAATLVGGVMLTKYERRGIMLLLLAIVLSTLIGVGQMSMTEEIYNQMLEDGDMDEEEYEIAMEANGLIQGIGTVMLVVCGGVCGLIVAIPLMISNNGLDGSKLFG